MHATNETILIEISLNPHAYVLHLFMQFKNILESWKKQMVFIVPLHKLLQAEENIASFP